jgi:hypothetical protein
MDPTRPHKMLSDVAGVVVELAEKPKHVDPPDALVT